MDIEQARTFLAIAAHGTFLEASKRLHLTQSTVSAGVRQLESDLGVRLFVRNRAGASLTQAGRRFLRHTKTVVLTAEQARHELGLSSRYRETLRVGGRIALWEGFLPRWVGGLRRLVPDVAVQSEIGFEDDLMRRMIEGTLDIALMYTPTHAPKLVVEHLFDGTLVIVRSRPDTRWPDNDYSYVDWGPEFYARHRESWPDLERPPQVVNVGWLAVQLILVNGGSCFLPLRMARPLLEEGRLFAVANGPEAPARPTWSIHASAPATCSRVPSRAFASSPRTLDHWGPELQAPCHRRRRGSAVISAQLIAAGQPATGRPPSPKVVLEG